MDLQRLERAIKDNPFTRNLHALHSEALRQGVSDIAAIDQLSADYVKICALEIVMCLRIFTVLRVQQGIHGSVLIENDMITVFKAIATESIEDDVLRSLIKTAIGGEGDKNIWDEISTLAVTLQFGKVAIAEQSPEMGLGDQPTGSSS
ncbi:hypothetical protein E4U30_001163 [Claviceps sp. LM220 group G6]|nr:hypothetical protein E4U30_001163 [Claviceps sp. LM220 group G6]